MENSIICHICKNPLIKVRCKKHSLYLCTSHILTHIECHDLCEFENINQVKPFPQPLKIELTRRLNLIHSLKKSILEITNTLINLIEVESYAALNKLDDQAQDYKSILFQDPNTLDSEQVDRILGSVLVKLPKKVPILVLNDYFSEDFYIEKPKSSLNSDLKGTLDYLKNSWNFDIQGHTNSVLSLIYDKNRTLYTGSLDQTIKVWDWPARNLKKTLIGHKSGVTCLEINKNNDKLVSGSSDSTVRIWCLRIFEEIMVLREHSNVVLGLCFTFDGKFLASCSVDNKIVLWEFEKMEIINIIREHQSWIFTVAASPDNQFLASGCKDNSISVWKLKDLSLTFTVTEHKDNVISVLFSLDSRYLFSGSTDKTIKVWSTYDFSLVTTLTDHSKPIKSLAVSETCLYSISEDGILIIWDIKILKSRSKLELKKNKKKMKISLALDNDKSLIAVGFDDEIKFLFNNSEEKIELNGHFGEIQKALIFSNYELAASYASDELKIWNIIDKSLIKTCKNFADVVREVNTHKELEIFLTFFS